jgi:hypothetical protein
MARRQLADLIFAQEILHRINNQLTSTIGLASQTAARSCSCDVKVALAGVIEHLLDCAPWEKRYHALASVLDIHKIISTEEQRRGVESLGSQIDWALTYYHCLRKLTVPKGNSLTRSTGFEDGGSGEAFSRRGVEQDFGHMKSLAVQRQEGCLAQRLSENGWSSCGGRSGSRHFVWVRGPLRSGA